MEKISVSKFMDMIEITTESIDKMTAMKEKIYEFLNSSSNMGTNTPNYKLDEARELLQLVVHRINSDIDIIKEYNDLLKETAMNIEIPWPSIFSE